MNTNELLAVETSVLRTLCLTANSETSALKKRILESLAEADFYFPITKSIFATVSEMSLDGINVGQETLGQNLSRRSIDVPDDFFLEDLFAGEAPSPEVLSGWITGLNRNGQTIDEPEAVTAPPSQDFAKTHPSVRPPDSTPSATASVPVSPPVPAAAPTPKLEPTPRPEPKSAPAPKGKEAEKTSSRTKANAPAHPDSDSNATAPSAGSSMDSLTPESGEWLGYLAELTKKQSEHLKSGFTGIDTGWGGLGTGLLLLAGTEQAQLLDLLKQLVDQIAIRCRVPCLYLSFERTKGALRLQTLSRLSGAPSEQIREGRFGKDSAEWQRIIRAGEHAVEWLQRIYVVEPTEKLPVTRIRELRESLIDSGAGASCLIAIDNLEKLSSESDLLQSVAELKELAESLGIVVVGVATSVDIVHERSADMAITVKGGDGAVTLGVTTPGTKPRELPFHYRPEIHRFDET